MQKREAISILPFEDIIVKTVEKKIKYDILLSINSKNALMCGMSKGIFIMILALRENFWKWRKSVFAYKLFIHVFFIHYVLLLPTFSRARGYNRVGGDYLSSRYHRSLSTPPWNRSASRGRSLRLTRDTTSGHGPKFPARILVSESQKCSMLPIV